VKRSGSFRVDQSSAAEAWMIPKLFTSSPSHDQALETPLAAREHFSTFDYVYFLVYYTFVFSGNVIFLQYCITLCDNCVVVLFCWNVNYHYAFAL